MKNKPESPVGVGAISILTILLVLSLAVFSALTFSTARADLALSRINADTVSAYYAADAQAVRLMEAFQAGSQPELEETIPVNDMQNLYIHLVRGQENQIRVEAWRTEPVPPQVPADNALPVYGAPQTGE